jgi:hypothetical protein
MGTTGGAPSETDLTHVYLILIEQSTSIQNSFGLADSGFPRRRNRSEFCAR